MISHKKLTLSGLALVASLTASLAWAGSAASGSSQGGHASGVLYAPSLSGAGHLSGTLTDVSGVSYQCVGNLLPTIDNPPFWSGYSSTGTIQGTLTKIGTGAGLSGVQFWGAYGMDEEGRGSFHAYLTTPSPAQGDARPLAGSFDGRFHDAFTINPATLLPFPGDFTGEWNLSR